MNDRIKELAEQANEAFSQQVGEHGSYYFNGFAEKFAELIVRECMKEAWEEIVTDEDLAAEKDPLIKEYMLGNNEGIVDAVIRFRNHFGIKE